MASEIHEIEISRRLSSGTHLFIPPLTWNLAVVGSAAHLVSLIQQSGRDAKIMAHPEWEDLIPESWSEDLWVHPDEMSFEFQDRPQWTWLWGLGHSKQHSQELNNFLLGLDSIQILDWTCDRVRRRGQFYHDCAYLGGLVELSFVISRDLWPVYNWESPCLGDALRYYMQQYPMTCRDAPLIHMAGQLELSDIGMPELPELAELRRQEDWSVQVYKGLSLELKQELQLTSMQLHQKESAENLVLVLEDEQGRSHIQVLTPQVDLELKLRKCLLEKLAKHSVGGFDLKDMDELMACLEQAMTLKNSEIKRVKPWPSSNYDGTHFSFACHDPQWEIERDNRLHTDEIIEEEVQEEEEEEQVLNTLDWDANLLIDRLKHLKLPTIKLTRRDLVVAHLPVVKLAEQDLKETHDRLEAERQAELQRQMQAMLDAKEEKERLERERLEAERKAKEEEAEKIRLAEEARAQAEAERLAEEERLAREAEAKRLEEEEHAKAERLAKEEEEKRIAEEERLAQEEADRLAEEEERLALEQAELEAERERREQDKDDYLHSDKEGWGAEEEEKDEDEELLESFQQLDRDHPVEEKDHYDEEERLDDSMGIEHPSYEMFDEEEDEDEQALIAAALEEDEEDLEAEELLEELEEDEPKTEEALVSEETDLKPEELLEELKDEHEEEEESAELNEVEAKTEEEMEAEAEPSSKPEVEEQVAIPDESKEEPLEEEREDQIEKVEEVPHHEESLAVEKEELEAVEVEESEDQEEKVEEAPHHEESTDSEKEDIEAIELAESSSEEITDLEVQAEETSVSETSDAADLDDQEPEESETTQGSSELVQEISDELKRVEASEEEESSSEEQVMSAEEILGHLEDTVEIVDLDPESEIDDEEEFEVVEEQDVDQEVLAEEVPIPSEKVDEPVEIAEDEASELLEADVNESEKEVDQTLVEGAEVEADGLLLEEEPDFEPEAADVTENYVNAVEFEEVEDGAFYEGDLDESYQDEDDTTKPEVIETDESAPIPVDQALTPPSAKPTSLPQEKVIGRKTATGYINPYLWDHHQNVNDLLSEVRQKSRLHRSDLAYVAIFAVVMLWAHLNQIPFI